MSPHLKGDPDEVQKSVVLFCCDECLRAHHVPGIGKASSPGQQHDVLCDERGARKRSKPGWTHGRRCTLPETGVGCWRRKSDVARVPECEPAQPTCCQCP